MLMHQQRAELQIGEETNPSTPPCFPPDRFSSHPEPQKLRAQVEAPARPHFRSEISSSATQNPQRRSVASHSSSLSIHRSPFQSDYHPRRVYFFCSKPCHCPCRLRLLILMVPLLYFVSNPPTSFPLELIPVMAFFIALLASLTLAVPWFSALRLFLARSFSAKLAPFAAPKVQPPPSPPPPVVWSIGCGTKLKKSSSSGSWVQVYSDGDVYEGEFHDGKCSGSGVYYYYKSGRYEGDWVDGKYDGYGIETWAKGSKYRGQYREGLRHGVGVYRFYTGDVYAGEWLNGQCHGCGVHNCADGSTYCGEFKWGVKHGLGHYHFRNGDTYAGEYFADKMHGFGVYQFGNGHRYEGAWHEGKRQGFGMYSFRDGQIQCGHWQNGVLEVPSKPSTEVGSPHGLIHSKVLNAVQEARQAVERAYKVARVEGRVNKAVAAANRSANAARVAAVKAVQSQRYQDSTKDDDLRMSVV
ncbi:hypothetical protein SAY86_029660 [Trapa natans]|uniref:Uncharacterized protein n=1 Tax=Trapa natans TaxID=22666 RepID=A0AAN7M2J3_TRANT|nr:hypothetical protein SAY86_029660 [Trapa natans]